MYLFLYFPFEQYFFVGWGGEEVRKGAVFPAVKNFTFTIKTALTYHSSKKEMLGNDSPEELTYLN